jgi:hypothetical protein
MTDELDPKTVATLDAMLDAAGIVATPAEREQLLAMYAQFKPGVDAMYALPEARYEAPALVFQAEPKLTPWRA